MNLQFADLNADGHDDILTATFEGTVMVVMGDDKGWQSPQHLKDSAGNNIIISLFYDMEKNNYLSEDRRADGEAYYSDDHCVSATAVDWDLDGDLDLILGAKEGRLYLRENEGNGAEPRFSSVNRILMAGGEELSIPSGATAAQPVDWDQDGDTDLLCGSFGGGLYFIENINDSGEMELSAPVKVLGSEMNIGEDRHPSADWYATSVDYDQDGKLDLLVGMQVSVPPTEKMLSDEERKTLEEAKARLDELQGEIGKFFEGIEFEDSDSMEEYNKIMQELESDEDYQKLNEEMMTLYETVFELDPPPMPKGGVWLFRRQ